MAPKTRLRSKPALHMDYVDMSDPDPALVGSRHNPVQLEDTPEPPTPVRKTARKPARTPVTPRKSVTRVKSGAVVKPKKEPKVVRRSPKPKRKVRPAKQECSICVTTKSTASSFKVPEDACEHFQSICGLCIQRMLKTKVAERQLAEPGLPCPFPDCKHALDYTALKGAVTKAAFEDYDKAVTKHALSAGESYIACLSSECGLYFSTEDCKSKKRGKHLVACPYCQYEICLACNRPWKDHGSRGCDKAKKAEDKASEATVKKMGAKPCPKCGMNIEKHGGCDHMTCQRCRHNFCWVCLAEYSSNVQHLDGCPHGRTNVAADPGNWVADNLTAAQINNMIRDANARRDNPAMFQAPAPAPLFPPAAFFAMPPQVPAMGQFQVPPIPPFNIQGHPQAPAPAPRQAHAPAAPRLALDPFQGPAFLNMLNPFNWMGGGGGGGGPAYPR